MQTEIGGKENTALEVQNKKWVHLSTPFDDRSPDLALVWEAHGYLSNLYSHQGAEHDFGSFEL